MVLAKSNNFYSLLISYGKKQRDKSFQNCQNYQLIDFCESETYLRIIDNNDSIVIDGYSESLIISGLMYLLFKEYHLKTSNEIIAISFDWLKKNCYDHNVLSLAKQQGFTKIVLYIVNGINKTNKTIKTQ